MISAPFHAWVLPPRFFASIQPPMNKVSRRPGPKPARNSVLTEVSVVMPYNSSGIDGGMMMPSVPAEAMAPSDRRLS